MPAKPRRHTWRSRLILGCIATMVSALLLEVLVRVFMPQPESWLAIFQRHPRLPMYALQANVDARIDTGETSWTVRTDDAGHRIGIAGHEAAGTNAPPSVLWLGDSFTFGNGVDYEKTWIGMIAGEPGARFRHLDAGVPGYGPTQYRQVLEDEIAQGLEPAAVVATTFLGNDYYDTVWSKDEPVVDGIIDNTGDFLSWIKRTFHTYRVVSRFYHQHFGKAAGEDASVADPEKWRTGILAECSKRYSEEFHRMASICATRRIPFIVMIVPTRQMVEIVKERGSTMEIDVRDVRASIAHAHRILEGAGIQVIDLTEALSKQDPSAMYFQFDGHFTPAGHALAKQLLQSVSAIH